MHFNLDTGYGCTWMFIHFHFVPFPQTLNILLMGHFAWSLFTAIVSLLLCQINTISFFKVLFLFHPRFSTHGCSQPVRDHIVNGMIGWSYIANQTGLCDDVIASKPTHKGGDNISGSSLWVIQVPWVTHSPHLVSKVLLVLFFCDPWKKNHQKREDRCDFKC